MSGCGCGCENGAGPLSKGRELVLSLSIMRTVVEYVISLYETVAFRRRARGVVRILF